jgi:hypothetical protein
MGKVKPIVLTLDTAEKQAAYFVNREFDFVPSSMIDSDDYWNNSELAYPSEGLINQIMLDEDITEDEFYDKFVDGREIYTGLYRCDGYFAGENGSRCNPDVLYELGIYLIHYKDEYFLNIRSVGVSYIDEYFIPLFKYLGWIKEE